MFFSVRIRGRAFRRLNFFLWVGTTEWPYVYGEFDWKETKVKGLPAMRLSISRTADADTKSCQEMTGNSSKR